jgi:hypothetical protein
LLSGSRLSRQGRGSFAVEHLLLGLQLLPALGASALVDAPVPPLVLGPEEHLASPVADVPAS